jgi:polysaccharide pyruvyl transferase WcaK-like protein
MFITRVKLNIIGAFDRFNYGDVLFAHIINEKLSFLKKTYKFQFVSTSKINLKKKAGFQTISMMKMFKNSPKNSIYLVAGGEVLAAPWWYMYLCLVENEKINIEQDKLLSDGYKAADCIARKHFGCKHLYPWVLERETLNNKADLIIYNAVGGSSLHKLDTETIQQIGTTLNNVDYISVRDYESKKVLEEKAKVTLDKLKVFPDCGILISDIFNKNNIQNKVSEDAKNLVKSFEKYLVFQSGRYHVLNKNSTDVIVEQLLSIVNEFEINIILLPFSDASFHEDNIILEEIYQKTNHPKIKLSKTINLYDITYIMMHANLFMGTSLHGNIVSFSYGVPSIGLTNIDTKLPEFIKTWIKPEWGSCFEFEEIKHAYTRYLAMDKEAYINKSQKIISEARINIENISNIILLNYTATSLFIKIKNKFKMHFFKWFRIIN